MVVGDSVVLVVVVVWDSVGVGLGARALQLGARALVGVRVDQVG